MKMRNRVIWHFDMDYMLQKDSLEDMKLLCGLVKPTIITLTYTNCNNEHGVFIHR